MCSWTFPRTYAGQRFQIFQRHHGECERHDRREGRGREVEDGLPRNRRDLHRPHHLEAIGQISEGLDVSRAARSAAGAVCQTLKNHTQSKPFR